MTNEATVSWVPCSFLITVEIQKKPKEYIFLGSSVVDRLGQCLVGVPTSGTDRINSVTQFYHIQPITNTHQQLPHLRQMNTTTASQWDCCWNGQCCFLAGSSFQIIGESRNFEWKQLVEHWGRQLRQTFLKGKWTIIIL